MLDLYRKIGVWGDSILKGVVFDEVRGAYRLLASGCAETAARLLDVPLLNKSRFGCTIDKGLRQLERSLAEGLDCDLVLLEYGGNDCDFDWAAVAADPDYPHRPHTVLAEFQELYRQMIRLLRQHGIEPLLMSLPPIDGERYLDFIVSKGPDRARILQFLGDAQMIYRFQESYSLAVTTLAATERCRYAPVREAFLAQRNCPSLICADGIHPNELGHQLMQQVFTSLRSPEQQIFTGLALA